MSKSRPPSDTDSILQEGWSHIVGGMNWLKSVFFGEFADNRPLSAVVADMLVSFLPGVVIVTSARDAVAVVLRLASHPEKREELMEWVLLCACLITIALPLAMAAGGAAAAGVGAVIGGIAGSELAAALRGVMLMLIKKASALVELVLFLQKFIKGDVLKFLRAVKFAKYDKVLLQALTKVIDKLVGIVKSLRQHLENIKYFDSVKASIATLAEWERKFYNVQQDALKQIPRALAELDARLKKVLAQTAPKEVHTVASGVQTSKPALLAPQRQRVRDTAGKIFLSVGDEVSQTHPRHEGATSRKKTSRPPKRTSAKPPLKERPDSVVPPEKGPNAKKQAVAEAAIDADREKITKLSNEGKIVQAQEILQPYVDAAKRAKTKEEKQAAMDAIIARLDVSSEKEKMFWSGDKELARKIAAEKGKVILEETAGGRVIDGWQDLNDTFSWDAKTLPPHGWDLWGDVSAKYSEDAFGEIDIIQNIKKFPNGGETWRGSEWTTIFKKRKVSMMHIYGMDDKGNILEKLSTEPDSDLAIKLFGGGT